MRIYLRCVMMVEVAGRLGTSRGQTGDKPMTVETEVTETTAPAENDVPECEYCGQVLCICEPSEDEGPYLGCQFCDGNALECACRDYEGE